MGGVCVGVLGATGVVGAEILSVLAESRFPLGELRVFASDASEGGELELPSGSAQLECPEAARVAGCDLVFSAAPGVLEGLLPALGDAGCLLVDVTGALELDPAVPLFLPGVTELPSGAERPLTVAIPRGAVVGLAMALGGLAEEVGLSGVDAVTLESASGVGRKGVEELTDQTVELLNAMTGEAGPSEVFPLPLAFDCLPLVGELLECGESSEERRLRHVLRRLLNAPALPVRVTRVRVPTFSGSLAVVHARLLRPLSLTRVRELLDTRSKLNVLGERSLPTHRHSAGNDSIWAGRIRLTEDPGVELGFVLGLDDLRSGSALLAVRAAQALLTSS